MKFIEEVIGYPHIERLNIGLASTMKISWDQPHEAHVRLPVAEAEH